MRPRSAPSALPRAASISTVRLLLPVAFAVAVVNAEFSLPDAISLSLSECRGDRQEQLGYAVAGDVAAEIEQMELDAAVLQALDDFERIEG